VSDVDDARECIVFRYGVAWQKNDGIESDVMYALMKPSMDPAIKKAVSAAPTIVMTRYEPPSHAGDACLLTLRQSPSHQLMVVRKLCWPHAQNAVVIDASTAKFGTHNTITSPRIPLGSIPKM